MRDVVILFGSCDRQLSLPSMARRPPFVEALVRVAIHGVVIFEES